MSCLNAADTAQNIQPPSADGNAPTPESVNRLRRKVQETEKLQSALKAEAAQNEALLAQLRPLMSAAPAAQSSLKPDQDTTQQTQNSSFSFLTNAPSASALGVGSERHANSLAQNTSLTFDVCVSCFGRLVDSSCHVLDGQCRKVCAQRSDNTSEGWDLRVDETRVLGK